MTRWTVGRIYFYAVMVIGLLVAAGLTAAGMSVADFQTPLFATFAVLAIATELIAVPLPRGGRLTASFAFLYACLITLGLLPTVAVVALIALIANLLVQRRHWSLALFNFSQYTLSYGAAQLVLMAGGFDRHVVRITGHDWPILLTAMVVQLLTNVILVNGYIALEKRISPFKVLWEDDRWEFACTILLNPLSITMVALYHSTGWKGASLVLLPLFVSAVVFVLYLQIRQSRQDLALAHHELSIVHQIAQRIGSQIELGQTLSLISSEMRHVIEHDECMIFLLNEEAQELVRQRTKEADARKKALTIKVGEGLIGRVAQNKTPVRIDQLGGVIGAHEDYLLAYLSALVLPIATDEATLGVMALFSRNPRAFDSQSERILTVLASQAAIAIKNAQLYETTQQLAITDGLTGVYNRRYFQRQLESEFRRAPRFGYPIALILLDCDYFKRFNDTHGHLLGDQVLRSLAQVLRETVRETDVVARYGGEEFAVILPETNAEQAVEVADRIRQNVARRPFWGRGQTPVAVTVSIGVASRLAADTKPEDLIDLADSALYQAKETGRDRICTAGEAGAGHFIFSKPREDGALAAKRRAPARTKVTLDVAHWQAYLRECLDPLMGLLGDKLREQDLALSSGELERWRTSMATIVGSLARQLEDPTSVGRLTTEQLVMQPLYPEIKAGITHLIQRGITLTQSESLVLSLCTALGQHVQNGPFSPQERLQVLAEVERFTHTLQLACSQVWHEFYQQTNEHLMVLHDLEQRVTNVFELDELLPEVVQLTREALRTDVCLLYMPNASQDHLRVWAAAGLDQPEVATWTIPMGAGIVGEVFTTLRPVILDDLAVDDPRVYGHMLGKLKSWAGVRSSAYFPLAHQGDPLGVLICYSKNLAHFEPNGIRLGRGIAGQMAAAIARMQAQDSRQDTYLQAITALVEALEAKDDFTRGHSEQLVRYATAIGRRLGLSEADLETLRQAGHLHDLGKIAIPESLLYKPDRLTPQERSLVETHPEVGARLLDSVASLKSVVPVVRHHHEHWNGTGYPDALQGEAIPLLARILAVSEAFDGMTTAKAYRPAIPVDEALGEMKKSEHFDPIVLAAFEAILPAMCEEPAQP